MGAAMRFEVMLVRHGETLENKADTLQGCDPRRGRLSPRGVEQSRRLGRALSGVALDVAWCSPLERAVTTLGGKWHGFEDRYEWTRVRVHNYTVLPEFVDLVDPGHTVGGKQAD